jgi:hypothetical protein
MDAWRIQLTYARGIQLGQLDPETPSILIPL